MIAIVLHYVYMSTFAWTFVESLHVYHMLTEVRNIDAGPMRFYYVVGWGIPAIITGEDPSSGPAGVAWTGHPPPFGESAWRCRHRCPCQVSPRPRPRRTSPLASSAFDTQLDWPPAEEPLPLGLHTRV